MTSKAPPIPIFSKPFYPHPDQITAVGLEDAFFLEPDY